MLKKENRLKKNKHFNFIYKKGSYESSDKLTLVYIKSKFRTYKVGFSVNNKVGKATKRNKIKRRMRESFKQLIPMVDRRYNYIFVAKPELVECSFDEIKSNMIKLLKKANLLNEKSNNADS